MAKQLRTYRKWKDVNFVANGSDTIDLPLGFDLETIHCYFFGSVNVTTAFTAIKSEGLANLIKRVDVLADGETIASLTGPMLLSGNFQRAYTAIKVNPGIAIGNYTNPEVVGFIDFAHVDGFRAKDSNLRTKGMRQLQLRITWGALSDMYTGAGVATTALTMTVAIRETKEQDNAIAPEVRKIQRYMERAYTTTTQDRIPLDTGMLYRAIVLRGESAGDASAAVVTNVKVMVGSDIILDMPAAALYDANCNDNGVALPAGYYVVDFAPSLNQESKISDCLDLKGRNDAFLILDVVGGATNKVQIVSHQFDWVGKNIEENHLRRQGHYVG